MLNDHIKENHGEMRIEALEELILDEEIALVGENTLEESCGIDGYIEERECPTPIPAKVYFVVSVILEVKLRKK